MLDTERFDTAPKVVRKPRRPKLPENPEKNAKGRFPSWLHRPLPQGAKLWDTNEILRDNALSTVCEECKCPNRLECFSKKTATYLVMGYECTRACGFCDIAHSKAPPPLETDEAERLCASVKQLGLEHVVITMVTRDDLPDGGAEHLANIIAQLRKEVPSASVEVLTSDFHGNTDAWDTVLAARPEIFNHNIETVRSLTPRVRHKATYERTLTLLNYARTNRPDILVKSGIMVGLGETEEETRQCIRDLKDAGCHIVTMGQYLQPNRNKLAVKSFITPEQFKAYEDYGHSIGIDQMYCGPFVRSSYNAGEVLKKFQKD